MKMKYVIIDAETNRIVSGYFTDIEEAKARCYAWRKKRYANGNIAKELEYDRMMCDMGFNVIKISDPIF